MAGTPINPLTLTLQQPQGLNSDQINILNALASGQSHDEQISEALGLDINLVRYYLEEMEKKGLIKYAKSRDNRGEISFPSCVLTPKGKVASQNPENLIEPISPKIINTRGGNYNEHIQGSYYEQSGNFGIGHMSGGTIQGGAKVAGVLNEAEQQNLTEAATQIQQLLEQLDKSYPANTTGGKMAIATEAIKQIEANPTLMTRVRSAISAGGVSALEALLNHPAASFVIGAFQNFQETGKDQS